ncbi:MAG: phosphoribulokinase [Pseudomonadota bacterium]|nr:phosphoribulokinase [Pseudomonadota bacterium]
MSDRHPIVAVTGSSGAGTSTVIGAFDRVLTQLKLVGAFVEGDAFHAFDREQMRAAVERARIRGENFSHFGPQANLLERLEGLFREYGEHGTGTSRRYLHNEKQAREARRDVGTFTPWMPLRADSDLLIYEGLHGGVVTREVDVAKHVDLLIGVVPIVNLEWIQKLSRDTSERGKAPDDVMRTILRRMPDYVHYITPQFSRTDINFQRVPLVDTANPFVLRDIPTDEESLIVIHFSPNSRAPRQFATWRRKIPGAFLSRPDTMVVPGVQQQYALELILLPALKRIAARRRTMLKGARRRIPPDGGGLSTR